MAGDIDFCNYLQDLIQQNRNRDLKRVAQIVLWSTNADWKEPNKYKHVFISASPSTRSVCERIKSELEKRDILVWMDSARNAVSGTNIARASRHIDRSRCVLVCICEKYRLSEKCQAEAKYAMRLGKHIIPLLLQDGFDNPDGWLCALIKDRLKVGAYSSLYIFNFSKEILIIQKQSLEHWVRVLEKFKTLT